MAVSKVYPEEQASELMKFLHSSNLHYTAQVTPFSMYITIRKKFRDTSHLVIPDQASLEQELDNQLKQKALKCHELETSRILLEDKLKKATDDQNNLQAELEEKYLESHELKATNNILHEKLQKAEAKLMEYCETAKEEKDELAEKVEFLANSVMRSTEETLSIEHGKKTNSG